MKPSITKQIETGANIAIIVVALLVVVTLVPRLWPGKSPQNPLASPPIAAGTRISLQGLDWKGSDQNLLLVLSTGCHFCSESAPFYKRLVSEASINRKIRLIGVFPQDTAAARQYLQQMQIPLETVVQVSLSTIHVGGTPTLILVDGKGVANKVWMGRLSTDNENEVLNDLR